MARRRPKKKPLMFWLVIAVVLILAVNLGKNWAVQGIVQSAASRALGVAVKVQDLNISFFSGEVAVKGLMVSNPPGFAAPQLLRLSELQARLNLSSLTQPALIMESIRINGITVYYEINERGNNLNMLYKNLAGDRAAKQQAAVPEGRQFIIRDLSILNASVEPSVNLLGQSAGRRVQLADIHLQNIGKEGKTVTSEELGQILIGTLEKNVTQKLPAGLIGQGFGNIGKGLKDVGKGVLGGFGN